ncbi:MAG TPA: 30S ribosome-binding factor RbfA, partial [Bacteroidetes bacterium]|nr:ribosome-binding factor A [bacterium BMS3Bbin04]HDO65291.1 30S ribosome-binding factor RbfA [Bacteroidota bacterium]HEX04416.1 30S ribosome-binding factor RbfA [Bacteroidota bacterium]
MKHPKTKRARRVGVEIQKILADRIRELIRAKFSDVIVSVPEVRLSDDLGTAEIYVSVFGIDDPKPVHLEIKRNIKQMRSEVAAALRIRKLPEFRFVWDDTMERADRIEKLLIQLNDPPPPHTEDPSDPA